MIYVDVTDKAVFSNGKPLKLKTTKKVDGIAHDEWHEVREDKNGVWYIQTEDGVYEVTKGLS